MHWFHRMSAVITLTAITLFAASLSAAPKKIYFIAGNPSHGFAQHEGNAGCLLLAKCLKEGLGDQVEVVVFNSKKGEDGKWVNGWPKDPSVLNDAAEIIMYCDGGKGHMAIPHLKELDDLAAKGAGIGCIHYAVEVPKEDGTGEHFLNYIGGYFETFFSVNPHWKAEVTSIPNHPAGNGVRPFSTNDEWYYHMRFRPNMEGVTPIVAAIPPDETRSKKDDAHGGNPDVRAGIGKSLPEITVWVAEGKTGNRGFGCTGGHFHWNWAQDDYRKAILNAIAWTAHIDVPQGGVVSTRPTVEGLLANLDPKTRGPKDPTDEQIAKQIEEMNAPYPAKK